MNVEYMESALQLGTTCIGSNGSPRIIDMRLNTTKGPDTIVSAPTPAASTEKNDDFYGKLSATIESVSKSEQVILLGDFYVRVVMIPPHSLQSLGFLE